MVLEVAGRFILVVFAQAESKRIAGLSCDGVPPCGSYMEKALEGKPKSSIQFAGGRDHTESIRNGLRGFAQADNGLSAAHVLPPAQVVLRDTNVVEQDGRRVHVAGPARQHSCRAEQPG